MLRLSDLGVRGQGLWVRCWGLEARGQGSECMVCDIVCGV